VKKLYPVNGTAETLPTYNTTFVRAGLIYRDVVLACPALVSLCFLALELWEGTFADRVGTCSGCRKRRVRRGI
jgi:hypothetical protein